MRHDYKYTAKSRGRMEGQNIVSHKTIEERRKVVRVVRFADE